MKCPSCPTVSLVMTDRSGIEIDYCPDCRGVWLDRGELDKIIERATPVPLSAVHTAPAGPNPADATAITGRPIRRDHDDDFDDFDDDDDRRRHHGENASDSRPTGKRRRKGLFGDLFDF